METQTSLETSPVAPIVTERRGVRVSSLGMALWVVAVAGTLALWLFILFAFRGQPGDDPYITYRYAANLAAGKGFVYNEGEQVQSTTTPLFTLILAVVGMAGYDIPSMAYAVNALSLLAFGVCCVGLVSASRGGSRWLGLATFALTLVCPVTLFGFGSEMPLLVALAWGSWWAAVRHNWLVAALLAGLATLTRGDGVLVAVAVGLYFLATNLKLQPRQWPWHAVGAYVGIILPWYFFAWLYFGSPLPSTLQTKVIQGSNSGNVFLEGLGYFWTRSFGYEPLWWLPALVLLVVGIGALIWRRSELLMPVAWAALFIAGYAFLHVPRYPWYYSPLVPVAMMGIVFGGSAIGDALGLLRSRSGIKKQSKIVVPSGPPKSKIAVAGGLAASLLIGGFYLASDAAAQIPQQRPWLEIYITVGRWIDANTPQQASVGSEEVGLLGYYSKRRIIDFAGLIQPDVAAHRVKSENLWVLQKYNPDYIVAMPAWLAGVASDPWVKERYEPIKKFELYGTALIDARR